MSIAARDWALCQDLKPVPKFVLVVLADAANDQGVCWPSVASIARKARQRMEAAQAHVELPAPGPIDESSALVRRMMEIAQRWCRK